MHINKKIILTLLFISLITVATAATWAFNFASTTSDNNVIYAANTNPADIVISSTSSGSTTFFTFNNAVNDAKIHDLGSVTIHNIGQVDGTLLLNHFEGPGLSPDLVIYYYDSTNNRNIPIYAGAGVDKSDITPVDVNENPITVGTLPFSSWPYQTVQLRYEYVSTASDQTPGISLGQFKVGFKLITATDITAKNS